MVGGGVNLLSTITMTVSPAVSAEKISGPGLVNIVTCSDHSPVKCASLYLYAGCSVSRRFNFTKLRGPSGVN